MTKAVIYSPEGYPVQGATDDPRMVSKLEPNRASETWKVGRVKNHLAIRAKTIESISKLLYAAGDGAQMEITYQSPETELSFKQTLTIRALLPGAQPIMLHLLTDTQIVERLQAEENSYISVTYRLLGRHDAPIGPKDPSRLHAQDRPASTAPVHPSDRIPSLITLR